MLLYAIIIVHDINYAKGKMLSVFDVLKNFDQHFLLKAKNI